MAHVLLQNEEYDHEPIHNSFGVEDNNYTEVVSRDRTRTDIPFLIFQAISLGLLGILIIYCMATGDIDRIIKGHDNCGNVCGKFNNFQITNSESCKAMDMTKKPYLSDTGKCVSTCNGLLKIGSRCIGETGTIYTPEKDFASKFLHQTVHDINMCSSEITGMSFFALGIALSMLLILRYFTAAFVWGSIIVTISLLAALTGFFWYLSQYGETVFTPVAIITTLITLIIIIIVIFMRNRIELVIQLFKEAAKSLTSMPLLMVEPVLTFVALAITVIAWIYFTLWIESAGTPVETFNNQVSFIPNGFTKFVRFYNLFIMLWMVFFVYGCQNMLIAGAVSRWYFTRDKKMLVNPILHSGISMLKYHLGTISIGALLLAIVYIIRMLWSAIRKRLRAFSYLVCMCLCFEYLDTFMKYIGSLLSYFTVNIYVVTATHGKAFYESGTTAFHLLINNTKNVIAINSIGDFVLFLTKLLIVALPTGLGCLILYNKEKSIQFNIAWAIAIIVIVSVLIAKCFVMVFEMAITTVFLCFCEDCEINDGLSRPYYMSQNLMDFVEKSKTVLKIKDNDS